MTVLITGAGGFVGLNLIEKLLAEGRQVVSFSRNPLDPVAMALFGELPGSLTCIAGDVLDSVALEQATVGRGVTALVHMATITAAADRERRAAADVISVNLVGLANALAAAAATGARFVYTSSIAVFGPDTVDGGLSDEESPHDPRTLYAITKSAGEAVVRRLGDLHGLDWSILRLGRLFGPWEHDTGVRDTMSQIYQATMAARRGETVSFARPCVKNWSYAPDTAADIAALLAAPDWKRRVYNLGAPYAWPLSDWCARLAERFKGFDYIIEEEGKTGKVQIDLWGDHDGSLLSWQAFEADFDRPRPFALANAFVDYMAFLEGLGRRAAV